MSPGSVFLLPLGLMDSDLQASNNLDFYPTRYTSLENSHSKQYSFHIFEAMPFQNQLVFRAAEWSIK